MLAASSAPVDSELALPEITHASGFIPEDLAGSR